ncbi:DUF349 domain-containing protein [Cellulomonas fengjieae]|uniref:DUF349 domain-containing protein n=1 Tax=Cellulomonas fengjieae TaxID=2819978 RepID=A0ABS3SKL8_9CELL|nr:DUF349 domain-containing protein [Cellulomonas fengjieae]MBO3085506.1 DUF349 domain-containing protein [Cellulomonas fengjieae]QVI64450.1 DUF349 domain-containing protein [Cellulomonas fengjieae]
MTQTPTSGPVPEQPEAPAVPDERDAAAPDTVAPDAPPVDTPGEVAGAPEAAAEDTSEPEATPEETTEPSATPEETTEPSATTEEATEPEATPDEAGESVAPADDATDAGAAVEVSTETEAAAEATTEAEPQTDASGAAEPAEPAEEPAPAETAPQTESATESPVDAPAPAAPPSGARPVPRPRPVPHPPAHPAPTAAASVPAAPVAPPQDAAEAAHAATFGSVDEEGNVSVREASGERVVGQYPGASTQEALALYVRRFLDLQAKVTLFEARLTAADLSVKEIDQTLAKLTEEVAEPAAVGDLDGLRSRLEALRVTAASRRAAAEAERAAAREAAVAARTQIVEQAEKIASTDPARIQWRPAGEQLRLLLDQWKEAQRTGPRLDRPTEESLWKRFSHARTTFDRERRHFFAELELRNASAKQVKENLVAEAERLQSSTDWGATAGVFRDLMTQWKAAGRASRADDDALWARFRAAQDAFFAARDAQSAATDEEFRANLQVKEALLAEAEALVPVTDLAAAKAALHRIQDRWEAAGKVPRADVQRVEGRLRAVETAIRDTDQAQWRRTNPETRARAEGAAAQLEQAIAGLEADLERAKAVGDARKIADAQAALDARRAWLEQVQRAAQDARG